MKRNFIGIAVIAFVLVLSANLFAQDNRKTTTQNNKARNKVKRVNMEDGVFLPGYKTTNKRTKTSRKANSKPGNNSGYTAGGTWVSGDPVVLKTKRKTTSRKKPKTQNLLPYLEQENLLKKDKYANQETNYRKNRIARRKNK